MSIYGFGQENASQLLKVARREGLRSRGTSFLGYPEPLASDIAGIRFSNSAGATIPAYGVMRITGASSSSGWLTVAKPDGTYRWLYLVNGSEDVEDGKPGVGSFLTSEAFAFDLNYVRYDTGATPAYGEMWGPKDDSWLLWPKRPGFFILGGNNTESGKERTVAIQKHPGQVLVKNITGSAIAAAGSGTATLYGGTALSEATLGMTMTVYNRSSVSWADTKYGFADLVNGYAYVSPQQT